MSRIAAALVSSIAILGADDLRAQTCAGALATVEADGRVSAGSKEAVRVAVRAGLPLRIGWGLDVDGDGKPEVSHWADASFLSEFEGEVFAQIHDIQRQSLMGGRATIALPEGRQRWSGLLGTNGKLESHFDDGAPSRSIGVRSEWCVDDRSAACSPQWRLAYRHDADGRALSGSKPALFEAVRRGYPLRLAWGFSAERGRAIRLEHSAEPVFVSIIDDRDLFVQVPEHIAQASYHEAEKVLFDKPSVMWRGLLSTTGVFDAVFVDRATGVEVKRLPQRAAVAWFAYAPADACSPSPLTLAVPGGVRRAAP
jgi:hypothetical protein